MGDITDNFSYSEFACQGSDCCSHSSPISIPFVKGLQELRGIVKKKVESKGHKFYGLSVSSGFRCRRHNASIPEAAPDGDHTKGVGADIMTPSGITTDEFYECAEQVPMFRYGAIGIYHNRLHLADRGKKARWDMR